MTYELRDYQKQAVEKALHNFDRYDKPFVLVLPTGSGKSLVISDICHKLNQPVLILQPTKEILGQNYEKLLSYGITDIGIYSASFNSKEINKYTYATIGSIYKKPELFKDFKSTGADFDEGSLEKFWDDKRLKKLADIIGEVDQNCNHNLIFCSSIRQAKQCSELLKEMGFSSDYITSEHGNKERDSLISKFRSGEIKHLANVGVLTVGFDFPSLDSITLARPTLSLALLYQMSGRGMRKDPDRPEKICQVIDITENIKKMGRIETIALAKEDGGFKDIVVTEMGEITNKPLFSFKLKDKEKIAKIMGTKTNE